MYNHSAQQLNISINKVAQQLNFRLLKKMVPSTEYICDTGSRSPPVHIEENSIFRSVFQFDTNENRYLDIVRKLYFLMSAS